MKDGGSPFSYSQQSHTKEDSQQSHTKQDREVGVSLLLYSRYRSYKVLEP